MKPLKIGLMFISLLSVLWLTACAPAEPAVPAETGLQIAEVWARPATAEGNGAVYMMLTNNTATADTLQSVDSPIAETIELHETVIENDVMRMNHLPEGIPLPQGQTTTLEPGGLHVMLLGLTEDLQPGNTVSLTLNFATAESLTVEATVREMSGQMGGMGDGMGN